MSRTDTVAPQTRRGRHRVTDFDELIQRGYRFAYALTHDA